MTCQRYKITLAYEGTQYCGWQKQKKDLSIQGLLQNALTTVARQEVPVTGAGRTDAGVHALAQVAHCDAPTGWDCETIRGNLNGLLPDDIRVFDICTVPEEFHARYSARGKVYHYHLWTERVLSPFSRRYRYHVKPVLDKGLMCEAARYFVGTHDFAAFANERHCEKPLEDTVRVIHRLDIVEQEGGLRLEFEGNGFLYKMVRNIAGCLIEVGRGKVSLDSLPDIFASKDRRQAPRALPPQGLFLVTVLY